MPWEDDRPSGYDEPSGWRKDLSPKAEPRTIHEERYEEAHSWEPEIGDGYRD